MQTQESTTETPTTSTRVSPQIGSSKHPHESRSRERVQTKDFLALDGLRANHPVNKGIPHLFTTNLLEEITQDDPILSRLCVAVKNKDNKKFASMDKKLAHFYQMAIEKDGILIIDNRPAIPTKAVV